MTTRGHTNQKYGVASNYDPVANPTFTRNHWRTCPMLEALHDPFQINAFDEQHTSYNATATTGDYLLTQATAGTAAMSTTVSCALTLNAGSTTNTQGPNVQRLKSGFVMVAGKDLWFECRFQVTSTTLKFMSFYGLAESNTAIIASSALASINNIGWSSVTGDGVLLFGATKASTATTQASVTLVSGTVVQLGFFYDGTADTVQQYVNGVATGTPIATANIPKVIVYPSMVVQSAGTDQPTLTSLGFRVAQRN